jgi:hypothetical protein
LDWIREKVSACDALGAIYIFPTLEAFLSGQPDQYRQAFGNPNTNFATPKYSGFIQDHWTVTNRFTLDAGIRYDFEHLPAQFREDRNDFAPRIGLAYSPSPRWALRAEFGMFFDRYLLAAVNRALEKNGLQGFEQVAYGQAATQIFQSELWGAPWFPASRFVRRSSPPTRTCRPRAVQSQVSELSGCSPITGLPAQRSCLHAA